MNDDYTALQDVVLFVEVARTRSFSRSAENLGLSPPTLSRRIRAMELRAGVQLFNRTTRRVELTSLGARFLERCGHLVDDAKLARADLSKASELPTGHLRISMPVDLGRYIVGPMLPAFAKRYPGITFSLDLSSEIRDLLGGETDIALRLKESTDKNLVTRRIGWLGQALYASPTYLDLNGRPSAPSDLTGHDCIFIGGNKRTIEWKLRREKTTCKIEVTGRFSVNNHGLICALAESDMGIAMLEPSLCRAPINAGRLVPVLAGWEPIKLPVFVVTTSHLQSAAARAFIDFVADRFLVR
jgi:DNA-binding transcriptional LysR family regulator